MKITYEKDFKHNYLVIADDRILEENYQIRMVTKNKLKGILQCQERMINGEGLLYYEVTSKQALINIYDSRLVKLEDVRHLMRCLQDSINELSKFILYGSEIILEPEYIFVDLDQTTYSFLYYPFYECNEDNNLKPLINYLLEHIDNDDMPTVEAVYQLADVVTRHHFALDEALEWFLSEFEEEDNENLVLMDKTFEKPDEDEIDFKIVEENENESKPWYVRLKEFFFRKDEEEDYWVNLENSITSENTPPVKNNFTNQQMVDNDATVFVPWIENCEHKLYGIGKNNKNHIDLTKAPLVVGKMANSVDMVITESSISRMHVKFLRQGSKYLMQDLNSTNGTFKNGLRLNPNQTVSIEPGDEIGLGKLKFIYR